MKRIGFLLLVLATAAGIVSHMARASGQPDEASSPIYSVKIPAGYRDWQLIAVKQLHIPGKDDQLRAQLGNDIAVKAVKEGTLRYPDGSIIVALHWSRVLSEADTKVIDGPFPGDQSFVAGSRLNMQIMVKDSKKYAATGGWGFADFKDGKPGDKALHETCFLATGLRKIAIMSLPVTRLSYFWTSSTSNIQTHKIRTHPRTHRMRQQRDCLVAHKGHAYQNALEAQPPYPHS
jgi:Cytochrome P460